MKYTPHAYQQTAINFLLEHDRGALFLDMGLGKTSITLTALAKLHEQATMGRVLIVAPLRVAQTTWPQELSKWDHLAPLKDAYAVACGPVAKRKAAVESGKPITIINRENLAWLAKNYPWTWDTVIIDELSSFKNHKAARFRVLRGALPKIRRMWGLTGTPTPNGLIDLWAQYRLIDAGQRLGKNIGSYRNEFFLPDKRNAVQVFTWKPRPGADQEIYSRIGDVTLSMQAKDHLDLPALTIVDRTLELPPAAQATYDQLSREMITELDGKPVDAGNAGVLAGKLLQLAAGAIYLEDGTWLPVHEAKLDALEDALEAANGEPVLVAFWWKHDLQRIMARFPNARPLSHPVDFRDWNAGRIPLGLIHPASAGHGLNLQDGGRFMVWFSMPWSLELYEQANARLYRQGQQKPVTITRLVVAGSMDEDVTLALARKQVTQGALLDAVKSRTGCALGDF